MPRRLPSDREMKLPGESDAGAAAMVKEHLGHRGRRFLTGPIALQFTRDRHPRNRNDTGHDHAADGHLVSFDTDAAGCIGDGINLVAFAGGVDRRHGEADFRPERRHDDLLAACLLYRVDDARIFPCVDERAIDRLLLGEYVLKRLDEFAAAIFQHRAQDGRDVEHLGGLGQRGDVVHDHCRLVAVQVGGLKGLVVDQDQNGLFRGQEGVQAALEDGGLGHGVHSGLGWRCFPSHIAIFIAA